MNWFILKCYEAWIDENIPKDEIVSNCSLWARVMQQAFPELILVGGYVRVNEGVGLFMSCFGCNYHEYLVTKHGDIVDPTKTQFDAFIGVDRWHYERWEEHLLYCN